MRLDSTDSTNKPAADGGRYTTSRICGAITPVPYGLG